METKIGTYYTPFDFSSVLTDDRSVYFKIEFEDRVQKRIHLELNDEESSNQLYECYKKYLKEAVNSEVEKMQDQKVMIDFEHWFAVNSGFFFNPHLIEKVKEFDGKKNLIDLYEKNRDSFERFFNEISNIRTYFPPRFIEGEAVKVAILTTSSGGGHLSAAKSIDSFLKNKQLFKTEIFNTADDEKESSLYKAIKIAPGDVYNRFVQKEHLPSVAQHLYNSNSFLKEYISDNSGASLRKRLEAFAPHIILDTMSFEPKFVKMAGFLKVPVVVIHTDYHLNPCLRQLINRVDPKWVKFALPDGEPHLFSIYANQQPCLYDHQSYQEFHRNIQEGLNLEELKIKSYPFINFGFPTRSSFQSNLDPIQIDKIKEKNGIEKDREILLLMMGGNGVSKIENIIKIFLKKEEKIEKKIHLIVACGTNKALKKSLEEMIEIKKNQSSNKVIYDLRGNLDEKEVADIFKIAKIISKTGGATTAEAIRMGAPILACYNHVWENCNFTHLEKLALATKASTKTSDAFISNVNTFLLQPRSQPPSYINWEETIEPIIYDTLHQV